MCLLGESGDGPIQFVLQDRRTFKTKCAQDNIKTVCKEFGSVELPDYIYQQCGLNYSSKR